VGVLPGKRSEYRVLQFQQDADGRILSLLVGKDNHTLNLINVYAPAQITDRKDFISSLDQYFYPGSPKIIGGDFNCIEADIDQFGHTTAACKAGAKELRQLKQSFDLIRVWRSGHRKAKEYTWYSKDLKSGSRLDKFLTQKNLGQTSSEITPCILSDHDYVTVTLQTDNTSRRTTLWKLNTSLLTDETYVQQTERLIDDETILKPQDISTPDGWDKLKAKLKHHSQQYARTKRRTNKARHDQLIKQLIKLKRTHDPDTNDNADAIRSLETTLNTYRERNREGAKIRSRAEWLEQGERPTKFFFALEKQRATSNSLEKSWTGQEQKPVHQTKTKPMYIPSTNGSTLRHRLTYMNRTYS
jgi:hypothetical protein